MENIEKETSLLMKVVESHFKCDDLKMLLAKFNRPVSGRKSELLARVNLIISDSSNFGIIRSIIDKICHQKTGMYYRELSAKVAAKSEMNRRANVRLSYFTPHAASNCLTQSKANHQSRISVQSKDKQMIFSKQSVKQAMSSSIALSSDINCERNNGTMDVDEDDEGVHEDEDEIEIVKVVEAPKVEAWINNQKFIVPKLVQAHQFLKVITVDKKVYQLAVTDPNESLAKILHRIHASNDEVEQVSHILSLKCPIGNKRIETYSCRSRNCEHNQCFDVENHLNLNSNKPIPGWKCPICKCEANPWDLIVDGFYLHLINSTSYYKNPVVTEVIFNPNGSWKPVISTDHDDYDNDHDVEVIELS